MDRKSIILTAIAAVALIGCSKESGDDPVTPPEPVQVRLTILTETVSLTSGGEGYVDFRISPFETAFNYDIPGGKSDISLSSVSGAPSTFSFEMARIEPKGNGEYRVFLKDSHVKISYSELSSIAFRDSKGRSARTSGFQVICSCDEATQKLLNLGLPLVQIITEKGEEPTCEYVSHPEGCNGAGIKNATKVPGSVTIIDKGEIKYSSGDYVEGESGMTVRIRGNTSAYGAKKPYKIKLQKKADLLFRNDKDKYKDKDWLLLRYDGLKMLSGFRVNELLGMQWTPGYQFVNVTINGDYRGLYMLTESVKRNTSARLNVNESGYIIEYDAYWWNEDVYFTNNWIYGMAYTFKYPEDDEVTTEQIAYIKDYIRLVENSVRNGTYDSYIDVTSFAKWLLGHDILGNLDVAGSNIFLTKYDNTTSSLLRMANLWDFDNIYRMEGTWSNAHNWGGNYFPNLLASSNKTFRDTYIAQWGTYSKTICKACINYLKNFADSETGKAVDASITMDNQRWRTHEVSVGQSVTTATTWFEGRGPWLDNEVAKMR